MPKPKMLCPFMYILLFGSFLTTTLTEHRQASPRDPSPFYSSSGDYELFCTLHDGEFVKNPTSPRTGLDLCFDDEGNYNDKVCDEETVKKLGLGWYDRINPSDRGAMCAQEFKDTYGLGVEGLKNLRDLCGKARSQLAEYYGEEFPATPEDVETPEIVGDIILSEEDCTNIIKDLEGDTTETRAITRFDKYLWPKREGVYPNQRDIYVDFADDWFEPVVEIERLQTIYRTMRKYERLTCYRFYHRSQLDPEAEDPGHILFTRNSICFAKIAYQGTVQILGLSPVCAMLPFVVEHELSHSMGVRHQHARPDRDYYVRIIRDRIVTGKESNFDLVPTKYYETLGVPYDVSSVMHYSTTAFSIDGSNTIDILDSRYRGNAKQAFGLQFGDIQLLNKRSCLDPFMISTPWGNVSLECETILAASGGHCYNSGYVNYADCKTCMCPQGLAPPYCDTVAPSSPVCTCAGEIEVAIGDKTCFEVRGYLREVQCSWMLKKGPGTIPIKLWFEDFDLTFCWRQFVEIRERGSYGLRAPRHCEENAPEPMYGDEFLVHFHATMYVRAAETGFRMCFIREI